MSDGSNYEVRAPVGWSVKDCVVIDAEKIPGGFNYGFTWQWLTPGRGRRSGGQEFETVAGQVSDCLHDIPVVGLVRQLVPAITTIPGDFVTLPAAPSVAYPREVTRDTENRPIVQMFEGGPLWVVAYDKAYPLKLTEQPE